MTIGPDDQTTAGHGRFLASHTDREQAVDTLKTAFVEGRLTKDELDARAGYAFAARTYADLAPLTADIPARPAGAWRQPARARAPAATKAVKLRLAACAIIPLVVIVATILSDNGGVTSTILPPLIFAYLMTLLIGVSHLVDSWLRRRRAAR